MSGQHVKLGAQAGRRMREILFQRPQFTSPGLRQSKVMATNERAPIIEMSLLLIDRLGGHTVAKTLVQQKNLGEIKRKLDNSASKPINSIWQFLKRSLLWCAKTPKAHMAKTNMNMGGTTLGIKFCYTAMSSVTDCAIKDLGWLPFGSGQSATKYFFTLDFMIIVSAVLAERRWNYIIKNL